jgi:hypothetical protein
MKELIGCGLVYVAFILIRFISPHSIKINGRLIMILGLCLFIGGLILVFPSDLRIGLIISGCFLWFYYHSLGDRYTHDIFASFYGSPFFANPIARTLGFVLLLTGEILLFFKSLLYGFISLVGVFLAIQILELLRRIEWKLIKKQIGKDFDCKIPNGKQPTKEKSGN